MFQSYKSNNVTAVGFYLYTKEPSETVGKGLMVLFWTLESGHKIFKLKTLENFTLILSTKNLGKKFVKCINYLF